MTVPPSIATYFSRAVSEGQLSHAYLFVGPHEQAKLQQAEALADALGMTGARPDFKLFSPASSRGYLIEQVKEIIEDARLAPLSANYKMYVLRSAEALTALSANALLKTLEEPPPNTIFILFAQDVQRVLPTIVSRTQVVSFYNERQQSGLPQESKNSLPKKNVSRTQAQNRLIACLLNIERASDEEILNLAYDLSEQTDTMQHQKTEVPAQNEDEEIRYEDVYLEDRQQVPDEFFTAQMQKDRAAQEKRFAQAQKLKHAHSLVAATKTLLHDMLALRCGGTIINHDLQDEIVPLSDAQIERITDACAHAYEYLERGVSVQLVIEGLLFSYKQAVEEGV